jgi:predicted acylesterase/phospholipase RssA
MGLFIILGYNSKELYDIFIDFEFDLTQDVKISNFIEKFGLDTGDRIEHLIKVFIKNKGFNVNITLDELFKKQQKSLALTVCNINTKQNVFFDRHNFPNIPCYIAVRASMNIPFIFTPLEYLGSSYVDGGLTCNIPVKYFITDIDNVTELSDTGKDILCVSLKDHKVIKHTSIEGLETFLYSVLKSSLNSIEDYNLRQIKNHGVSLITMRIVVENSLNFKMKSHEIKELIDTGYTVTKNFFEKSE